MPRSKKVLSSEEEECCRDRIRIQNLERQRRLRENRRLQNNRDNEIAHSVITTRCTRKRTVENNSNDDLEFETRRNEINLRNNRVFERNRGIQEHYLGAMNTLCMHCNAKHFESEKVANKGNSFNDCCSHGTVRLDKIPDFPNLLHDLFNGIHEKSKLFFNRIRNYNSMFSFASFNANLINMSAMRNGPYCFKIQGQIYYQINSALYPSVDKNPSYGQLFIVDSEEAINYRIASNSGVDNIIIHDLERIMRENNAFVHSYQMMKEEIEHQRQISMDNTEPELQLLFTLKPGYDKNRYNFQRVNEVAAVFSTTADGDIPEAYVTIRNINQESLQILSSMDPIVEPMIYPLFYPHGTLGWNKDLLKINNNSRRNIEINNENVELQESSRRVTRNAYVKYRIAIRPHEFNAFLLGRRLFQQWIVDSYVKTEKDRIQYCRDNQKQLRAESYQGLTDHLSNIANDAECQIGKIVILPATFLGSPRYMMQNYQDAMAIVRAFGKPDLFITMTCNPNWREIKENLLPNQQACDRPDLIARVFHLKKEHLMNLIVKQHFFGKVSAHVHVVEFQKRGLPHAHILVTLIHGCKLDDTEKIDKFIQAEIPDPDEDPYLYDIVVRNMIHGPCDNRCIVDGKCSKRFPKDYQNETTIDFEGYPKYRRKNNGRTIKRCNKDIDNRYVVPYCPELLRTYNCHINVEVVSSITSVKYLYKYVYKGHDAAHIVIEDASNNRVLNFDETKNYLETRYVGPVEACYRILSKLLQNKSHAIIRLCIHLPQQQTILIEDVNDEVAVASALNKSTMLLDYFELNKRDKEAKNYLYVEIPHHYVFKQVNINGNKCYQWMKRKSHFNTIGRMYSVSPTQVELFRLRLLLLHVKGATSFDDLKNVNGIQYNTFSDTCLALGLIETDEEWSRAMQEAVSWMMPRSLRQLLIRILIHCQPVEPEKLWNDYKDALSEDFFVTHRDIDKAHAQAYLEICEVLRAEGRCITDFPSMPSMPSIAIESIEDELIVQESLLREGTDQYNQLNDEQRNIVDSVINSVKETVHCGPKHFYIDGPGGTGKTFVYNTIYNILTGQNKKVCPMAFTGIAATLLPKGMTVHKVFGLPVPLLPDSSSNIKVQSREGKFLRDVDVFIWDEAPMAPRYALEIMDRTLRDIMNNNLLFGGKIVILGGDFRQLLPILVNGTRFEVISLSIKYSHLWNSFHKYELKTNMRVLNEELSFAEFVLNVGNGEINDHDDKIIIPESCIIINSNIVDSVFKPLIQNKQYEEMSLSAILSARNVDVDEINNNVVLLLDGSTERIYTSIDSAENCDDNGLMVEALLPEYLNSLNPSSLPPYELRLRINCVVMLIRNLSINAGLCNGTRLRILEMTTNLLKCKILTGDKKNDIVFINRITLYSEKDYPFTFKRRQFPVKLAFAMTINKAQGQTFSNIGIDLRKDVFTHGQLYVAISRVRSLSKLKIFLNTSNTDKKVKNYVFKEILS